MTRAVLFDLDDTLYDFRSAVRAALAGLRVAYPALQTFPPDVLEVTFHRLVEDYHARLLAGEVGRAEARRRRTADLFAACGAPLARGEVERAQEVYLRGYRRVTATVPGAAELLGALRRRLGPAGPIGVITNNARNEQVQKLAELGLAGLVDFLVTPGDAGVPKPDPAIFDVALARAGCGATEAVMVGDAWATDIVGARVAGLRAVWLNRVGGACPDPAAATEIRALRPTAEVAAVVLGE